MLERVDVRRVDEDEPRLDRVVGHQTDLFGWNARESAVDERLLSAGWTRMTATRVVGRRTPVELAARPAIVLKIVLLPAPVGPTRRTTTGASREAARTRT